MTVTVPVAVPSDDIAATAAADDTGSDVQQLHQPCAAVNCVCVLMSAIRYRHRLLQA